MAEVASLVNLIKLSCEPYRVVGGSQGRQPGRRVRIIGRSPIEAGAVSPDCSARLRIRGRLTLASTRRKHARKSLGPFGKGGRRIALTLCLASGFHRIAHRAKGDGGHIQARLPRSDGIKARYASGILLSQADRREANQCARKHNQIFQHRAPPDGAALWPAPSKLDFNPILADSSTYFAFLDADL